MEALKTWNAARNNGMWCTPRKGSKEHAEVIKIQLGQTGQPKMKYKLKKPVVEKPVEKKKKAVKEKVDDRRYVKVMSGGVMRTLKVKKPEDDLSN
jgi:hypothetical protein